MLTILGLAGGVALSALSAGGVPQMAVLTAGPEKVQAQQQAPDTVQRLWQALDLGAMMPILQEEAVREAVKMEAEGLIQGGGRPWPEVVAQVHQPDRLAALFQAAVLVAQDRVDAALLDQGLNFYEQGPGRRLVALETSARRAMLEEEVEADAIAAFARAEAEGHPRAVQIQRLIEEADLVSPNVAGGLNALVAFSRGFAQGGGFDMPLTEEQLMADTWAQQEQIEADAQEWLQAFLMLAYAPLSDGEMEDYIAYATSPAGQALALVLYAAFDQVFEQASFDTGLAAALRMQGRQL
ncbi:MAG: hypothetical protein FJX25_11290 [Alphaproteobacteria bacterium]|nr:hypothetical protein [Alphaproteobacteria bacterium]